MITALLLSAVTATAAPGAADDGWLAWYGCWRAQGDASSALMCVVPADNGVRLLNVVDGKVRSETQVIADGVARSVEREGCKGTESAKWSKDMQRVFITSEMACGRVQRKTTGIISMSSPTQWMDVESVSSGDQTLARTVRYVAAYAPGLPAEIAKAMDQDKLARETARYAATAAVNLDDVAEAAHAVDEHAVTEWLTAINQQFDLTGKKLVKLSKDGVSPTVIDVLVAVSNPQLFAIRTRADDRGRRSISTEPCFASWYEPWAPSYYNRYHYDLCRNGVGGYGYGKYYGGYYGYYGGLYPGYAGGWYSVGPVVVVGRENENPNARVTRNGYSSGSTGSTGRTSDPAPRQPSTTTSTSTSSGSSGEGAASAGGGTRTAHPRKDN